MTTIKIIWIDAWRANALTPEMMKTLGVEIMTKWKSFRWKRESPCGSQISDLKRSFDSILVALLVERDSAYRRLAEGVK